MQNFDLFGKNNWKFLQDIGCGMCKKCFRQVFQQLIVYTSMSTQLCAIGGGVPHHQ